MRLGDDKGKAEIGKNAWAQKQTHLFVLAILDPVRVMATRLPSMVVGETTTLPVYVRVSRPGVLEGYE
jgi:hypothetical protein